MIIKRLTLQNFKSFKDRQVINLDLGHAADGKKVLLIGGMNGGGKTTLLEAVNYCLYGAKSEQIFERINRQNFHAGNTNVFLELCFETDDRREVIIQRTWQPNGRGRIDANNLREVRTVTVDGAAMPGDFFDEFIDQTIPQGISQFFFFDGEKIQYMASDVDADGRLKSAMESVLGIEIVRKLHEDLKSIYGEDKRSARGVSTNDVEFKEAELRKFSADAEELWQNQKEAIAELAELEAEKTKWNEDFNKYFGFPPELSEKKKELDRQLAKISVEVENITKDIKLICGEILPFVLLADLFPELEKQLETEKGIKTTVALKAVSEQLADQLVKSLFDPKCVACEKEIPHAKHAGLKARISASVSKVIHKDKISAEGKIVLGLSDAQEAELVGLVRQVKRESGKNLQPLLDRRDKLVRQQSEMNRKLRELTVSPEDKDRFDALKQELDNTVQNIGRKKQEIRTLEADISKADTAQAVAQKELETLLTQFQDEKENSAYLQFCSSALKAVDEYIEELRKTKVVELEKNVFEMYRELATHNDLTQRIDIDPDTFQVSLVDQAGHPIRKETLSAGQKEIFAISLLWGLGTTTDYELPIIIDTPLSRLDSRHREHIIKRYYPTAGVQVIVLSTDTEIDKTYFAMLEPHVSRAMQFVLNPDGTTRVEAGYFWKE